jgi:hypothetical protein
MGENSIKDKEKHLEAGRKQNENERKINKKQLLKQRK